MKIAHVADLHIDERSDVSLDEQVEILKWVADDAADLDAQVLVCAGDIYEGLSSVAERNAAAEVFQYWASLMPVIGVRGNHDVPQDLEIITRLKSQHQILLFERPATWSVLGMMFHLLPWPRKGHLVAASASDASRADVSKLASQAMRTILADFSMRSLDARDNGFPSVFVGHVELGTALADSGQPMAGRCDIEVGESDLMGIGADYYALGHIHKHQVLQGRICYPGSPRQTSFGEDTIKGYCLVDVRPGQDPIIEHRRSPAPQRITVHGEWRDGVMFWEPPLDPGNTPAGQFARLVYEVAEHERAHAREMADLFAQKLIENGARGVKVDARTQVVHRIRSEEIVRAETLEDKLRAYWAARGETPERAGQIVERLDELQEIN